MSSSPLLTQPSQRYRYLDIGRGIAILGVMMIHTCGDILFKVHPFFRFIILNGARGVQLFYMISGITIAYSLQRNRD